MRPRIYVLCMYVPGGMYVRSTDTPGDGDDDDDDDDDDVLTLLCSLKPCLLWSLKQVPV